MSAFYHIVPAADRCSYISIDKEGNYIVNSKTSHYQPTLVFRNPLEAQSYIYTHLDEDNYKVEEVYINEKYYENLS